jgi:Leucine-rich repeat (LRR) protein
MRQQSLSAFPPLPAQSLTQQSINTTNATPLPIPMPRNDHTAFAAPQRYSEFLTVDLRYFLVKHYLSIQDVLALSAVDKDALKERFCYPQLQQLAFNTETKVQQFLQCCQLSQENIDCTGAIRTREDFYSIKKLILTLNPTLSTQQSKPLFNHLLNVTTLEIHLTPTQSLMSLNGLLKAARPLPLQHLSIAYPVKYKAVLEENPLPDALWQWPTLKTLILKQCEGINHIPEELGKLNQLTLLHVSAKHKGLRMCSPITPPNSLAQLNKLKSLTLEGFTLSFTDNEILGKFSLLQSLTLDQVNLPLQHKILNKLSYLEHLHVGSSYNVKLFDDYNKVTLFQHLKSLEISGSFEKAYSLVASLGKLDKLKKLVLRDFNIEQLPPEIGQLKGLTTLKLKSIFSIILPKSLKNLQLKKLSLADISSINTLPTVIGKITTLEILKLRYIEFLSGLPHNIGNLKNLTELSLHGVGNGSFFLPKEIGQLQNLHTLRLSNVDFETLPDSLWNLKKLKKFTLSSAVLDAVSEKIGQLTALTSLKLHCYIDTLPSSIWNLTRLENLSLGGFKIQHISEKITQLQVLTALTLKDLPQLQTLPAGLQELTKLKQLVLKNMRVHPLPERSGLKITHIMSEEI